MNRAFKISIIWQLIISLQETDPILRKRYFMKKRKPDNLFTMGVKSCLEKNLAITPVSLPKELYETARPPEAACLEQSHLQALLCTQQTMEMVGEAWRERRGKG